MTPGRACRSEHIHVVDRDAAVLEGGDRAHGREIHCVVVRVAPNLSCGYRDPDRIVIDHRAGCFGFVLPLADFAMVLPPQAGS